MQAIEFLKRLKKIPKIIENCELQLLFWDERAYNTTNGGMSIILQNKKGEEITHKMDRIQTTPNGDPLGTAIANRIDLENKIKNLKKEKENAEATIEQLDPNEYDVLYKHYILEFRLYEIADRMKMSYSGINKIQKSGLANLQNILDNIEKCKKV